MIKRLIYRKCYTWDEERCAFVSTHRPSLTVYLTGTLAMIVTVAVLLARGC